MQTYTIEISPSLWADEAARNAAKMAAALEGQKIVCFEAVPGSGPNNGADMQAILREDGTVFARLLEYRLECPGKLLMAMQDEPAGIPDYRLAPLQVLAALSPTEDPVSLRWRDLSRHALAQAGVFARLQNAHNNNGQNAGQSGGKPDGGEQRVRERAERIRERPRDADLEDDRGARQSREAKKAIAARLIVDRAPSVQTAAGSGMSFLKFTGYLVEGANGFIKCVVFQAPEAICRRISNAIAAKGAASISLDGRIEPGRKGRELKATTIHAIEGTDERIPARQRSQRQDNVQEHARGHVQEHGYDRAFGQGRQFANDRPRNADERGL